MKEIKEEEDAISESDRKEEQKDKPSTLVELKAKANKELDIFQIINSAPVKIE